MHLLGGLNHCEHGLISLHLAISSPRHLHHLFVSIWPLPHITAAPVELWLPGRPTHGLTHGGVRYRSCAPAAGRDWRAGGQGSSPATSTARPTTPSENTLVGRIKPKQKRIPRDTLLAHHPPPPQQPPQPATTGARRHGQTYKPGNTSTRPRTPARTRTQRAPPGPARLPRSRGPLTGSSPSRCER